MGIKSKKSKTQDFDPESILDPAPSSSDSDNSGFESDNDAQAGREHYADVGQSKLRKKEVVPLGPQYTGSKISRHEILDDDSDDPFARKFDEEDSDDDDSEDGEEAVEANTREKRPITNGFSHSAGSESEGDEEVFGEGEEDADSDASGYVDLSDGDMSDSEEVDEDDSENDAESNEGAQLRKMMGEAELDGEEDEDMDDASEPGDTNAQLRKMLHSDDRPAVTSGLSQAAKADVEKGLAIKTQRKTFDSLLNGRIRLQKALIASNTLASDKSITASDTAIQSAEAAALTLLNNLTDLRSSLDTARAGQKRKRHVPFSPETSLDDVWNIIQKQEASNVAHRKTVLEKWSQKTKGVSTNTTRSLLNTSAPQSLIDVLNSHLSDMPRLVKRTQQSRSCGPGLPDSANIYDDADFYGLLLKELLEQRSQDVAGSEFVVAPWQAAREAKTKKVVDTKASKGRKLRYTVMEKLQNFSAPEDRGTWGERQRDELFSSLFGRKVGLGEEEVESEEEGDKAEEGLMLFRS